MAEVILSSYHLPIRAARIEVTALTSAGAENGAQFMGFRDCPVCGETLFAAERAEFVCVDRAGVALAL